MITNVGGKIRTALGVTALLFFAACETTPTVVTDVVPPERPVIEEPLVESRPPPQMEISPESQVLMTYYQRLQNDLVARGLLRTDGGGPDTMFTDTMLARNFVRIALFDEYITTDQGLRAETTQSTLRRWEKPIRFAPEFGDTVTVSARTEASVEITNYVARLARVTGHPMSVVSTDPNFHVLVLNENDRIGFETRLREIVPGIDENSVRAFLDVPRDTLCLVLAFSTDGQPQYSQAVAMIRNEHPDLMRRACIHEELAQGLGLANDSPQARPSIFNDDEEFGLLTSHDELLLKMLYDDRLQTGMTVDDAAPIARVIATELTNSGPV